MTNLKDCHTRYMQLKQIVCGSLLSFLLGTLKGTPLKSDTMFHVLTQTSPLTLHQFVVPPCCFLTIIFSHHFIWTGQYLLEQIVADSNFASYNIRHMITDDGLESMGPFFGGMNIIEHPKIPAIVRFEKGLTRSQLWPCRASSRTALTRCLAVIRLRALLIH